MITLPALCFDKLALSVNTHGLGAGRYYRYDLDRHVPVPLDFVAHFETCFGDCDNVHRFGITTAMSDKAVYAINKRKLRAAWRSGQLDRVRRRARDLPWRRTFV